MGRQPLNESLKLGDEVERLRPREVWSHIPQPHMVTEARRTQADDRGRCHMIDRHESAG